MCRPMENKSCDAYLRRFDRLTLGPFYKFCFFVKFPRKAKISLNMAQKNPSKVKRDLSAQFVDPPVSIAYYAKNQKKKTNR